MAHFLHRGAGVLFAGLAAMSLAGCQSTGGAKAGPATTLQDSNSRLRGQIAVIPTSLTGTFYRQVAKCTYSHRRTLGGASPVEQQLGLTVRSVRDRLLITLTDGTKYSTGLISPDGTLHDFNLIDDEGRRLTSETYAVEARRLSGKGEPVINQFTAMFPRYLRGRWDVGAVVADVRDQHGGLWAEYIYRGRTDLKGRPAAVLDMMAVTGKKSGPLLVGFNVIDVESLMPLLYVFQTQNEIRLERLSCP